MIKEVISFPAKELRRVSSSIRRFNAKELIELIEDMKSTMYAYNGVGLAAPQVGEHKRLIVVDWQYHDTNIKNPIVLVSPKVVPIGDETFQSTEGCLSVPHKPATITRANKVEVTGKVVSIVNDTVELSSWSDIFFGFAAAVFQHEVDHLEGILFFDHMKPVAKDMYVRKMKKNIARGDAWRYKVATSL